MALTTAQLDTNITARTRHTLETETLREIVDKVSETHCVTHTFTLATGATVGWVNLPHACTVTGAYSTVYGTTNTGAEVITFENSGTALTAMVLTIASGAVAGESDTAVAPTANNVFTAGEAIEIISDGGNGAAVLCTITILYTLT